MKSISKLRHIQESNLRLEKRYLMEQTKQFEVPQKAIDAVRNIESKFSFMSNGKINGRTFEGNEKVGMLQNYMAETIGLDCWNNMSDKFKAQIYAFCFQADGDVPYKLKIIAGLANAIDSNIVRKSIVNKPISDPSVQNAIQVIKNNCQNINSYYDRYLTILDQQYKSMDYNDNYRNIWMYRPIAIDKIMNGQDIDKTLEEWSNFLNGDVKPDEPKPTSEEVMKKFVVLSKDLNTLNVDFKNQVANYIKSKGDINYDVDYFDLSSEDGLTSIAKLDIVPNENGYNRFSILFNPKGKPQESLNNALSKNPGSKLIKDGTITIDNKEYEYHLIGLHI